MADTVFSIIIPTYNSERYIDNAIQSVVKQQFVGCEIIVVDDASTDNTYFCAKKWLDKTEITVIRGEKNQGPGIARNVGVNCAKGKYILFLDSDDELEIGILEALANVIDTEGEFDICDYDFSWKGKQERSRKDMEFLALDKTIQLQKILKLHIDAQVIFTCYRKEFLASHNITFKEGYHEDVAFFYKTYFYAQKRCILNQIGYLKNNREGSIVNSCSRKHIDGFYNAWNDIYAIMEKKESVIDAWRAGAIAIGAVKIRDILNATLEEGEKKELYELIVSYIGNICTRKQRHEKFQTRYYQLVNCVFEFTKKERFDVQTLEKELKDILKKSWSCWDIENALFLGDDELRVCCKRFFVNEEKKGDVVLTKLNDEMTGEDILDIFVKEKRALFNRINSGEKTECEGCPYLSYDAWEANFKIKKISFEYHSLCNLRCIYCSEKYFGGRTPCYNIVDFTDKLIENNYLDECESVVWGGGEPVIEKHFKILLKNMASKVDAIKQNVITNATKYEPLIADLLSENKINVITSIDAGREVTYNQVRGKNYLDNVFRNLQSYANSNANNIIVKYIVMEENCSYEEICEFASKVEKYGLTQCNFQISCNFNKENLTYQEKLGTVLLYSLLKKCHVKIVYFDELLRERMQVDKAEFERIKSFLSEHSIESFILEERKENIVLWGSDNQIKSLLDNTMYFASCKPKGLIAGHDYYVGKECKGFVYQTPEDYKKEDIYIVIAAVQGTRRIYEEVLSEGILEEKIIEQLIL